MSENKFFTTTIYRLSGEPLKIVTLHSPTISSNGDLVTVYKYDGDACFAILAENFSYATIENKV